MIALSFVICTTGARQALLDEVVLPGIFEQPLEQYEVIVVGRYRGRHTGRVRVIDAVAGGELFYKPFQLGVEAAQRPWIVDLDDDMLLAEDWAVRVAAADIVAPGMYGFRMVNPDGTLFGTYFDAVDNRLSGRRRSTSYFSSYLAPTDTFRAIPYPTYQSGDRAHALQIRTNEPSLPWRLLRGVHVTHLGQAAGQPGLTPKTTLEQIPRLRPVLRFLDQHEIAWIPFAERCLDGRHNATLAEVWAAARMAVGETEVRQRHNWLL